MLTDTKLADFIVRFLQKKGEPSPTGERFFVPKDINARIEFYRLFIKSLVQKYKYTEDDIKGTKLHKLIIDASHNTDHKDKDKKAKWVKICEDDWAYAIAYEFEKDDIVDYDFSKEAPRERIVKEPKQYTEPIAEEQEEIVELENPLDFSKIQVNPDAPDYTPDEDFLKYLDGNDDE